MFKPKFPYIELDQKLLKTRFSTRFSKSPQTSRGPGFRLFCSLLLDIIADRSLTRQI